MYRQALRSTPRAAGAVRQSASRVAPRRFASTVPADKPRSWKSSALRWGLAAGAVYYYSTSPAFAEEPYPRTVPEPPHFSDSDLKTVDAVIEEKRQKLVLKDKEAAPAKSITPASATPSTSTEPATGAESTAEPGSPQALQDEAGQQGAFNPETGEINWDCPCLGGMADGPCGEEFKSAFSCFVYSEQEPKGIDCIEKFQGMQDCFRKYPEVYGAELQDDEEGSEPAPDAANGAAIADKDALPASSETSNPAPASTDKKVLIEKKVQESKKEAKAKSSDENKTASLLGGEKPQKAPAAAPAALPTEVTDATAANLKTE